MFDELFTRLTNCDGAGGKDDLLDLAQDSTEMGRYGHGFALLCGAVTNTLLPDEKVEFARLAADRTSSLSMLLRAGTKAARGAFGLSTYELCRNFPGELPPVRTDEMRHIEEEADAALEELSDVKSPKARQALTQKLFARFGGVLSPCDPAMADIIAAHSEQLLGAGQPQEATGIIEPALKLAASTFGDGDRCFPILLVARSQIAKGEHQFNRAINDLQEAADLFLLERGRGNAITIIVTQSLAECLHRAHRFPEAADTYERLLRWLHGLPDTPETLAKVGIVYDRLAIVHLDQNATDKAVEAAERALVILSDNRINQPQVFADAQVTHALTIERTRGVAASERELTSALENYASACAAPTYGAALARTQLARLCYESDSLLNAAKHLVLAYRAYRTVGQTRSGGFAEARKLHAQLSLSRGRAKQAVQFSSEALDIILERLGARHPAAVAYYIDAGTARIHDQDVPGAAKMYNEACRCAEENPSSPPASLAVAKANLALCAECAGLFQDARRLLEEAVPLAIDAAGRPVKQRFQIGGHLMRVLAALDTDESKVAAAEWHAREGWLSSPFEPIGLSAVPRCQIAA